MKACIKRFDADSEYFFPEGCYITEVSNSDDDPQMSIARARVEPGETTAWHHLEGVTERYVILEGTGVVELDGNEYQVTEGDVVIFPPGYRQRVMNTGEVSLVFLAVCTPRFTEDVYVND